MTHLLSTSVTLIRFYSSLLNKTWRQYHSVVYFSIVVDGARTHPTHPAHITHLTQVHIQITFSCYSFIDLYFHEFVGSALARFERSTLSVHKGTRTVVLRFLKIITPVKCVVPFYDGHICWPKEGELHQRSRKNTRKMEMSVWNVNIDKSKGIMIRGLQLLWDT